jgi:hypothetical protein
MKVRGGAVDLLGFDLLGFVFCYVAIVTACSDSIFGPLFG